MIKKITLIIIIIVFLSISAMAQTPMEAIKQPTDKIVEILKDKKYADLSSDLKEQQWNEIWNVVKNSFEFNIISRLAAGKYWKSFSDGEKKKFIDLFSRLLANTYIDKVQENFKNQTITYVNQKIKDKKYAEVLVKIPLDNKPVPIIYKLLKKKNWLIYDVRIEGMSMIKNYRSQFDEYLFKKSPGELIDALTKKLDFLAKKRKS